MVPSQLPSPPPADSSVDFHRCRAVDSPTASLLPLSHVCVSLFDCRYYVFTSSDPSADHLTVIFASSRIVLQYDGSFSALRPAEVRERDKSLYASYVLTALRRQHTGNANTSGGLYGYDWRDETRSIAPRATLTIARTFDQYTVNIAIINLTPAAATPSSPSATYSRSLFPLLHSVRTGIVQLQSHDKRVRERLKRQQEQLDFINLMLDDKSTDAEAVEEEWLGVCMRLLNAEKAKIREMRAKTDRVKKETSVLTAKPAPAAVSLLSESDSENEEKDQMKGAESDEVSEVKDGEAIAAAVDDGPAPSHDSGAMELSFHPDSSFSPASLTSMPSLQPDSNAGTQRSSSTSSSPTSSSSLSKMSSGPLEASGTGRRSVRKRARVHNAVSSPSAASSVSGPSIPSSISLSSSLNGAIRLLPPPSASGGKPAAPTLRAPSPATSMVAAVDGRQSARQGVTGLLDEL